MLLYIHQRRIYIPCLLIHIHTSIHTLEAHKQQNHQRRRHLLLLTFFYTPSITFRYYYHFLLFCFCFSFLNPTATVCDGCALLFFFLVIKSGVTAPIDGDGWIASSSMAARKKKNKKKEILFFSCIKYIYVHIPKV